ncbi:MAG TPA: alpha/beta hydrolase [Egibacteraceae bacterium]|nr:alpha/beta hydrolase [Egibacteraceae bacterium]
MHEVDAVITHRMETVNGIGLHWVEAGDGPLVVLLHGFPEFWYSWRHQIPALAQAGYRVVAPDMRGYNESDKPTGYDAYTNRPLTGDVADLIRVCGEQRATIVGHDWGGWVAWMTAILHPEVVDRLVSLNIPHPRKFSKITEHPTQLIRSSYIGFFQLPDLPELALSAGGYAGLKRVLRAGTANKDAFTDADLDRYVEAFSRPGALTSALAYYRAAGRRVLGLSRKPPRTPDMPEAPRRSSTVHAPTMVIWGPEDPVFNRDLADPGDAVPDRRVEIIEGAGHFVQSEAPDRVNELLLDFLPAPTRR